MITFYTFSWKVGTRSFVEVEANNSIDYKFIRPYLYTTSKDRLPSDVYFSVVKGKRWTDIILLYEAATHKFFSQRLIDILEQFIDLRNKCYPIDIAGAPFKYYTIYNLEELPYYIDPTCTKVVNERRYFEMIKDYPHLFTVKDSNLRICTQEVKQAIEKAKLTNIEFDEIYGVTKDECDALGLQLREKNM